MKRGRLILFTLLALVLIVVCSVGGLLWFNLTRMIPQHSGVAYVQGLNDVVEILRDDQGIPHIYASNVEDLFFAQGYVEAQDRWWQMEFQRHVGQGRIEELTGYNTGVIGTDLFIRTAGWRRAAEADLAATDAETMTLLQAYADGVNGYIAGRHGPSLALEYTLLGITGVGIEVEPWTPLDSMSFLMALMWDQSSSYGGEIDRMEIISDLADRFGEAEAEAMLADYFVPYPTEEREPIVTAADLPLTAASLSSSAVPAPLTPPGVDYAALNVGTTLAGGVSPNFAGVLGFEGEGQGIGSNSWTISGEHTASGMPLLANDPHIGIQMPSIWYEVGLHCRPVGEDCPYDVVGFSPAGMPFILIGHNAHAAWGLTNGSSDTQDLYILRINPDNPLQYEYNGAWLDMETFSEVIAFGSAYRDREDNPDTENCEGISGLPINDEGDLEIQVRVTRFGPIITDNSITDDCVFVAQDNDEPLALRWPGLDPFAPFETLNGLNIADSWEAFREAGRSLKAPVLTLLYADVDGNIGMQLPGSHPVRAADHSGLVPVPGWTDEYEWRGFIPYDLLPRVYNPERGWIVTANHIPVDTEYYALLAEELGDDANYWLSQGWDYGYRSSRAIEMVSRSSAHTADSLAEIQTDNHSGSAEEVIPYLVSANFEDEGLNDAAAWLAGWDLQAREESAQAALYNVFWVELTRNLWDDQLGFESDGSTGQVAWATRLLLEEPENTWWDDISTEDVVEVRDDILARALQAALDYMAENYGEDRESWRWGDLHTAEFVSNPLGLSGIGLVENLVNLGPVAVSGGWETLNRTSWRTNRGYEVAGTIDSMRMIVDFSDFDSSLTIHPTGQSGHPLGPHYSDMLEDWRTFQYHAMNFSPSAVDAAATERMELRPSPDLMVGE